MTTRSELRKIKAPIDGEITKLWFHRWVEVREPIETGHSIIVKNFDVPLLKEVLVTRALVEDKAGNVFTIGINQFKFI
jgi:hypothetical protein|tara:strand:+ start:402 stop:635 length:234 start_codon:yes stop_codon:yes gene_type:complete